MCEKGQEQKTVNSTSGSSTSADPRAQSIYNDVLGRASGVANTPYQSYQGPLVAPINSQQQTGINSINSAAGFASPFLQQAQGLVSGASNPLTQDQIQNYLNPYTQNVVDATQAQFDASNRSQNLDLKGNLISQGAFGGNRRGVLEAELAGQQNRAQNPVIAGLYSSGYGQALNTAAQQYQQNPMAAGNMLANFGISGQNAALSAGQQQLGAGNLEYQQQQAGYDAAYKQFLQQQAYPFQTAQWYAGLAGGIAPQYGSSTSGTGSSVSTQPAASPWAQIAGLGVSAAAAFSDERVKEGIEPIGKSFDGQTVYKFRYKGSPTTHLGFLAQEVEKKHPEAVGQYHGVKTVDYEKATDGYAGGGAVPGFAPGGAPMPYMGADSWVPEMAMPSSRMLTAQAQHMPEAGFGSPRDSGWGKTADQASAALKEWNNTPDDPMSLPSASGFSPSSAGTSFLGGSGGGENLLGTLGFYADGGAVLPEEEQADSFMDRALPAERAIVDGTFDPQGTNFNEFQSPPDQQVAGFTPPMPRGRPEMADAGAGSGLPPQITGRGMGAPPPSAGPAMGFAPEEGAPSPAMPFARDQPGAGFGPAPVTPPSRDTMGGFNPLNLSDKARMALVAAGLATAASRNPSGLGAIGEGGMAGFGAYARSQTEERKEVTEARKLARDAEKAAADLSLRTQTQVETGRHNRATESQAKETAQRDKWQYLGPSEDGAGSVMQNSTSGEIKIEPIKIGAKPSAANGTYWGVVEEDPVTKGKTYGWIDPQRRETTAPPGTGKPKAGDIDPTLKGSDYISALKEVEPDFAENAKAVGDYKLNISSLSQRGGLRERIAAAARRYNPDFDQTQFSGKNRAVTNFSGGVEGRTVRSLNVAIDHLATLDEAAKALQNSDIPMVNKLVNKYREATGNPVTTNFDSIKQVVSAEIAKSVVGGQTALHDREDMAQRARNSQSPEQLSGIVTQFKKLMAGQMNGLRQTYEASTGLKNFDDFLMPETKKQLAGLGHAGKGGEGKFQPPPTNPTERKVGETYSTGKGPMKWMGNGWTAP